MLGGGADEEKVDQCEMEKYLIYQFKGGLRGLSMKQNLILNTFVSEFMTLPDQKYNSIIQLEVKELILYNLIFIIIRDNNGILNSICLVGWDLCLSNCFYLLN